MAIHSNTSSIILSYSLFRRSSAARRGKGSSIFIVTETEINEVWTLIQSVLLISLILTFVVIMLFEFRNRSVSLVLWAGLFIFFLIPHVIDIVTRSDNYEESTFARASLFALLFNVFYLSSRIFIESNCKHLRNVPYEDEFRSPRSIVSPKREDLFIVALFALLTIAVCCLFYFIKSTLGDLLSFTWIDMFENQGGILFGIFSYLFSMTIPLLFISYKYKHRSIFIGSLVMMSLVLFVFRIRAFLIPITIPFILSYIYGKKFKLNIRNIGATIVGSVLIVYSIFGIQVLKIYGTLGNFISSISFSEFNRTIYGLLFSRFGEFGLRNAFYYFIENDNNFSNFGLGLGYRRLLLLPLPSSMSLGIKPQDFAMDMAYAYDPVNSVVGVNSMHPTLYGDCYANFGWYGVLLGVFWAIFSSISDMLTKDTKETVLRTSLFVSCAYAFTLIARGAVYNGTFNVFFILITHYVLWITIGIVANGVNLERRA